MRRSVIDDAMVEMAHAVLETILRIADDVKYKNVVIFENCHILKVRVAARLMRTTAINSLGIL